MSEAIVIIRPSFKKFSGQDACRASLFNQFLFWIAGKAKGQPEDKIKSGEVYWYGSAEDIHMGIDQNWSIWKVRKEVDILAREFIGRRHNPKKGWDREYHYFIGLDQGKAIREACEKHNICLRHLGLNDDVLHLLKTVNAFDENRKCDCPNQPETTDASAENRKCIQGKPQMDLMNSADPFTENRRAIPKDTTKGSSQGFNPKGTERSNDPPTSLPPEHSSFNSPILNVNSEEEDADASGLPIVSQPVTTSSEVETHDSDAPPKPEGYKTSDSSKRDNASHVEPVMENSTVSTKQLLSWLATLEQGETDTRGIKHFAIGRLERDDAAVGRLLSVVHSLDQARDLYKRVRSQKLFSDGRIIWGTNLANNAAKWQDSKQFGSAPAQPFTEVTRKEVLDEIRKEYPTVWAGPERDLDDPDRLIILLWHGGNNADYVMIRDRADWEALQADKAFMLKCEAFADYMADVLAAQQREAVPA